MIEFEMQNVDRLAQLYDPRIVTKALTTSIRKVANKGATLVSKEVRKEYNISAADVRKKMKVKKLAYESADHAILFSAEHISLMHFDPQEVAIKRFKRAGEVKQRRIFTRNEKKALISQRVDHMQFSVKTPEPELGVTVRIRKTGSRALVKGRNRYGAFLAKGRGGGTQVFMRRSKTRLPVDKLSGPSLAQMVDRKGVDDAVGDLVYVEAPGQFAAAMDFYLGKELSL